MIKDLTKKDKSSFFNVEKDLKVIISKILSNQRLLKLLYYPTIDCLSKEDLNPKQIAELISKNIKITPQVPIEKDLLSYIIIAFDGFTPNQKNEHFRDNLISFDIICNTEIWNLGDFQLRPYKIMGELDGIFNETHLTGIGTINFYSADLLILDDKICGYTLTYRTIHGDDDLYEPK